MLDYKLLEALAAVVGEGSFEGAARALHITQPAVSQRIKQLEALAGQVLLVRASPPRATAAGSRLIKHLRQVRQLEDHLFPDIGMPPSRPFSTLAIGVNADSIATWFLDAVAPLLAATPVLLDLRVDDQERTQELLRTGDVVGSISTLDVALQGCRAVYLGGMAYRLYGTRAYAAKWFADGMTRKSVETAPFVVFNRSDRLHEKMCRSVLGAVPGTLNAHYLPSSERFVAFIEDGHACGMIPEQQIGQRVEEGTLIDLAPGHVVVEQLYWHCWNLPSPLLAALTRCLMQGAAAALHPSRDN